jgi:hypothetical protein
VLRYDGSSQQFMYNWSTPSGKGCYEFYLILVDGSVHQANFSLNK